MTPKKPIKPAFNKEAEQRKKLGWEIAELEHLQDKIENGWVNDYSGVRRVLNKSTRTVEALAAGLADQQQADEARALIFAIRNKMEELRRDVAEKMKFENFGLPNHTVVRKAFALIRSQDKKNNLLATNGTELGANAASILFETGASTDPDVLGAVILNQYSRVNGSKQKMDKLLDLTDLFNGKTDKWAIAEAEGLAWLRKNFSQRLVEIYLDTSPFGHSLDVRKQQPVTNEMVLISSVLSVYFLERQQKAYVDAKKKGGAEFRSHVGPRMLELIEYFANQVSDQIPGMPAATLKARMEKSVAAATKLINAKSNVAIRAPGSPSSFDQGW